MGLIDRIRGGIDSFREAVRNYQELIKARRIVREYEENPIIYNIKHHGDPMHRITTCVPHEVVEAMFTVALSEDYS